GPFVTDCFRYESPSVHSSALSLHDALPIWSPWRASTRGPEPAPRRGRARRLPACTRKDRDRGRSSCSRPIVTPTMAASELVRVRSEEHTSELQSLAYLVCRLLLEKTKVTEK